MLTLGVLAAILDEQGRISLALTLVLLLVVPSTGSTESRRLHLVEQLGVGWKEGSLGWMSFVAFNVDGTRFSPDGRFLITPSTGGLITWPYDRGGTIRVFRIDNP